VTNLAELRAREGDRCRGPVPEWTRLRELMGTLGGGSRHRHSDASDDPPARVSFVDCRRVEWHRNAWSKTRLTP
jgi:hypothetical protein